MTIAISQHLGKRLCEILQLPPNVKSIDIRFRINEPVTVQVETESFVNTDVGNELVSEFKIYKLVEAEVIGENEIAPRETPGNFRSYASDPYAMQPGADESLDADLQILERCRQRDDDLDGIACGGYGEYDDEYHTLRKRVLWGIGCAAAVIGFLWWLYG